MKRNFLLSLFCVVTFLSSAQVNVDRPVNVAANATNSGVLKVGSTSNNSGDQWWIGFGGNGLNTDANDRARIGVNLGTGGAGRLIFTTGGAGSQGERMRIMENGAVGIGNANPAALLHVGSGTVAGGTLPGLAVATGGDSYLSVSDGTRTIFIGADVGSGGKGIVGTHTNHDLSVRTNNTDRMTILAGGNVGIGNTSPSSALYVGSGTIGVSALPGINVSVGPNTYITTSDGTKTAFMGVDASGYGMAGTLSNHDFVLRSNNVERARIAANGNIGINTPSPAAPLDVNGIIKGTKLDIATGAVVTISLSQCGGPCGGDGVAGVGAWANISAQGYGWQTHQNTATDVFSHNGSGTITVLKAGTYMITLNSLAMPTANQQWVQANAPYINGGLDAFPNGGNPQYKFGTHHAGYWEQGNSTFVRNLAANTTVQWGYTNSGSLYYWGHDGYVGMQIVRIN